MSLSPLLIRTNFSDLAGWVSNSHALAFEAFRRSALYSLENPYKSGSLGISFDSLRAVFVEAAAMENIDDEKAKAFFEKHFIPHLIETDSGTQGFVTGFYEPEVLASFVETPHYSVPLLGIPDDLIKIDDKNRPDGMDPYLAFGRQTDRGPVEYYDRAQIDNGAIGDKAKALAWLHDPVDAYFVHVQGAARLVMPDGQIRRVTYAAKSGQRFTGAGKVLVELGEIALADVTMQSIRAWLAAHPHRVREILHRNRSYIFFREAEVEEMESGPVAAAKVPLTAGRSIAVDRLLHTFGTPFFINAEGLTAFGGQPFRRLMIAQDTGSAIVGPARGDLFAGSGDAAGEIAGVVRSKADFYALVPRVLVEGEKA